MKAVINVHSPQERLQARMAGESKARTAFVQLLCIASILRTALTRLLPLAGGGAWWMLLVCLLPGLAIVALLLLLMRLTHAPTLQECVRACLGRPGSWLLALLLGVPLLLDGASSITALITMFTEGVGTHGTQVTLALLTGGVLLASLHREGLPRAVYLLRYVLLGAAALTAVSGLRFVRADHLFPMMGEGAPALKAAFYAGFSLAWPLVLLLTLAKPPRRSRFADACPAILAALGVMLFLCLSTPGELLIRYQTLADCILLPARYADPAVRTLYQCLLMLVLFLAIGGAVQLAVEFFCAPLGEPPKWLPYGTLILLTASQALDVRWLWGALGVLEPWLALPFAGLMLICLPGATLRRKRT